MFRWKVRIIIEEHKHLAHLPLCFDLITSNNKWIFEAFSEYLNFNGNLFQERSLKNKHYHTHANKVHIFWEGYKNLKKISQSYLLLLTTKPKK